MFIGLTANGSVDVKVRNRVPVIRHWRLVWEIREGKPQHYAVDRATEFQVDLAGSHALDLGPVDIVASIIRDEAGALFIRLEAFASIDGLMIPLGSIERNLTELIGNTAPAGKRTLFSWQVNGSARGVTATVGISVYIR